MENLNQPKVNNILEIVEILESHSDKFQEQEYIDIVNLLQSIYGKSKILDNLTREQTMLFQKLDSVDMQILQYYIQIANFLESLTEDEQQIVNKRLIRITLSFICIIIYLFLYKTVLSLIYLYCIYILVFKENVINFIVKEYIEYVDSPDDKRKDRKIFYKMAMGLFVIGIWTLPYEIMVVLIVKKIDDKYNKRFWNFNNIIKWGGD